MRFGLSVIVLYNMLFLTYAWGRTQSKCQSLRLIDGHMSVPSQTHFDFHSGDMSGAINADLSTASKQKCAYSHEIRESCVFSSSSLTVSASLLIVNLLWMSLSTLEMRGILHCRALSHVLQ